MSGAVRRIALLCLFGVWAWVFITVWNGPDVHQFDFKTYFVAAHTYEIGKNPYDVTTLRDVANQPHLLGFYYPLSSLYVLRPLDAMNYPTAHRVWVALKLLAFVALLLVWKRWFLAEIDWTIILLAVLLAFNAATVWDIKTGNITVFEQLFLWTGLACFTLRRMTWFTVCIVLASCAKLLPAVFLLLLLLPAVRSRANAVRFLAGALGIVALTLVPFMSHPDYFASFVGGLTSQHPRFQYNPTILGLVDDLALRHPAFASGWLRWTVVAVWYGGLLAVSARLLRAVYRQPSLRFIALVAALGYAVFAPRLIIYSYMIAIVPALALLIPVVGRGAQTAALMVALCISGLAVLPIAHDEIVGKAAPWILLILCWLTLIDLERTGKLAETS